MSNTPKTPAAAKQTHLVTSEEAGMRLDRLVRGLYAKRPLGWIYGQIRRGGVRVGGKKCPQNHRVAEGDVLELPALPERRERGDAPRDWQGAQPVVLAETSGWLALCKPVGLSVQGGKGTGRQNVVTWLRRAYPAAEYTPAPAHRIDRETSGLLLCAKKASVARRMLQDFKDHRVRKEYLALAQGELLESATVDAPLEKIREGLLRSQVNERGLAARTDFEPLARGGNYTLVLARPRTGRTHQIRAHLSHLGHPLAGDVRYGGEGAPALGIGAGEFLLHAWRMDFPDPDRDVERIRLEAPLPARFGRALARLEMSAPDSPWAP